MDILSSFSVQTLPSSLLHDSTTFLLAFSYLLFSQKHVSINRTILVLNSLPLPLTLLLSPPYPRSLIFSYLLHFYYPLLFWFFSSFFFYSFSSYFFLSSFLFFLLFFLSQLFLFWSLLFFTFLQTSCHIHLFCYLVNPRTMASELWNFQNYTPLLFSNYINLHSFSMFLIININLYCILNRSLLVEETIHIPYICRSFYYF